MLALLDRKLFEQLLIAVAHCSSLSWQFVAVELTLYVALGHFLIQLELVEFV